MATRRRDDLDAATDALFQLPLSEFTSARNALAARLKKEGRALDGERVKSLAKPSAAAWAVNQLYWRDAKAIDGLIAVAGRARKAQTGQSRNTDLREILGERKRMMSGLLEDAAAILRAAGHAASPDTLRRVSATLESIAVLSHAEGAPRPGRLTADLDPPGFDALAGLMPGSKVAAAKVLPFRSPAREAVEAAEKLLRETRRDAERAQAALARATAQAKALDEQKAEIEARCAEAKESARRAAQAVAEAERKLAAAKSASKKA